MKVKINTLGHEFSEEHYYFNQIIHTESYKDIIRTILSRKKPFLDDADYQFLVNNSIPIFTISKFHGKTFLGERIYAQIGNMVEMICINDFGEHKLSKILDGPFFTFQEIWVAFNAFVEAIKSRSINDKMQSNDNLSDDNEREIDELNEGINSCMGEFGYYYYEKIENFDHLKHIKDIKPFILKRLNIKEEYLWTLINVETVHVIWRFVYTQSEENESVGERVFAKVGDNWKIIYDYNFRENEYSEPLSQTFDSEEELVYKIKDFIYSYGYETPEYFTGLGNNNNEDYFNAMTDGQLGDFDDFQGNIDDLDIWAGH